MAQSPTAEAGTARAGAVEKSAPRRVTLRYGVVGRSRFPLFAILLVIVELAGTTPGASCSRVYQARLQWRAPMRVCDAMHLDVQIANPNDTIMHAAKKMAQIDAGVLPVGDGDHLVGMITDRDIAIRAVAEGRDPETKVRDIMSPEVKYCFEDEDVRHVARNMGDIQVRRLPVVNRDKRLVGMISVGDIAISGDSGPTDEAMTGISRPGGPHSQTGGQRP